MTFVETQFPTDISYGSSGGPEYSTDVVITQSGYEQRNINWSQARARYNVAHGIKSQEQLDVLIAFFRARKGMADGFRFKDWTDYNAVNQLIGIGDSTTTDYQLLKLYNDGGATESRIITKPVMGTISIYIDTALENPSNYSVDYITGIISFNTPPASNESITADFEFDVPVRFDTDRLSATIDSYASHSWYDIPLVEIRL